MLERAVDCYRKAHGHAQCVPADPGAQDDGEAGVLAQRLGMLVQAGVPRHLRAKVWPLLLGAHRYDPGEYDALVALATRHEAEELVDDSLRSFYPHPNPARLEWMRVRSRCRVRRALSLTCHRRVKSVSIPDQGVPSPGPRQRQPRSPTP